MTAELIENICESRMIIGFLGEKNQASWWDCSFLSPSSTVFLVPVFPNSLMTAQYSGLCQAASIIHDDHIGLGKHYHIYRLPASIERALTKPLKNKTVAGLISTYVSSRESALNRLKELCTKKVDRAEGPVAVGDFSDAKLNDLFKVSLAHYIDALEFGYKTFPYMRCL